MELWSALPDSNRSPSSGVFPLMVFNNGNERLVDADDDACSTPDKLLVTVACRSFSSMRTR
jgi:hypothetical protein